MDKVKVGVVGTGALGRHHTRLYKELDTTDVIGIFDVNPENAEKVASEFGVKAFSDLNKLADACDALSIAVPATKHFEIAKPLLEKKKHLLIEKPLAATVEEAEEIVAIAERNNVLVGVGHNERFNPAITYMEKNPGTIRFIEANRVAPYPPARPGLHRRGTEVSVILDLMVHDLDIILSLVDSEIECIDAIGAPVLSESEDIANVRLKFKNGCIANITTSRISEKPSRLFRIFRNDAYFVLDLGTQNGVICKKGEDGLEKEPIEVEDTNALQEELRDFIDCVAKNDGSKPKVCGTQGYNALKLAAQITEKLQAYNEQYGIKAE
jgi:predicted dehydrogenase